MNEVSVIKKSVSKRKKLAAFGAAGALAVAGFGVYAAGNLTVGGNATSGEGVAAACATDASVQPVNPVYSDGIKGFSYLTAEVDIVGVACSGLYAYVQPLDKGEVPMADQTKAVVAGSVAVDVLGTDISADELGSWAVVVAQK